MNAAGKKVYAVDFDSTIATYTKWKGPDVVGSPIAPMIDRIKAWLDEGHEVRIFTARANPGDTEESILNSHKSVDAIREFCLTHVGKELPVTYEKSPIIDEFWDDKAIGVVPNEGKQIGIVEENIVDHW